MLRDGVVAANNGLNDLIIIAERQSKSRSRADGAVSLGEAYACGIFAAHPRVKLVDVMNNSLFSHFSAPPA